MSPPRLCTYPLGVGRIVTRVIEVDGGGDAVVFIHGVGARADRWQLNLEPVAALGHRALAFDLPGHGFATKGRGLGYTVPRFAEFASEVLDQLEVPRAVLVGTSMGAHIAATLARDGAERVSGLVLVGPLGLVPLGRESSEAISRNLRDRTREGIRAKLVRLVADGSVVDEAWVAEEYRCNNSPGAEEAFEELADYFLHHGDDDTLGPELAERIGTMPVLVVWGDKDVMVPTALADGVLELFPTARLTLVGETGHAPYRERPEAFNDVIARFLRGDTGSERHVRV